jgi:hypothetical protein
MEEVLKFHISEHYFCIIRSILTSTFVSHTLLKVFTGCSHHCRYQRQQSMTPRKWIHPWMRFVWRSYISAFDNSTGYFNEKHISPNGDELQLLHGISNISYNYISHISMNI